MFSIKKNHQVRSGSGSPCYALPCRNRSPVNIAAWNPVHHDTVVTCSDDCTVHVWKHQRNLRDRGEFAEVPVEEWSAFRHALGLWRHYDFFIWNQFVTWKVLRRLARKQLWEFWKFEQQPECACNPAKSSGWAVCNRGPRTETASSTSESSCGGRSFSRYKQFLTKHFFE